MRILVDADACPVKDIIIDIGNKYNLEVILFSDTSHELNYDCNIITVDKSKDSVDLAIIKSVLPNDIVVTQDYGLAAIALSKKAKAINPNGIIYNDDNINQLLFDRFLSAKSRKMGINRSNIKKRTKEHDEKFKKYLLSIINNQ